MTVTGSDVRQELECLLERDLLGPWDGPTEELPPGVTPGERYLLGKLVPKRDEGEEPGESQGAEGAEDDDVEDRPELVDEGGVLVDQDADADRPSAAAVRGRAMAASAIGLSFSVSTDVDEVRVEASWGRYERGPSATHVTDTGKPRMVWRREPAVGGRTLDVSRDAQGDEAVSADQELVRPRWRVLHRDHRRVVEVFLVNTQPVPQHLVDQQRLFQVEVTVTATDGTSPVFCGHNDPDLPEPGRESDDELRLLSLQHRSQRLYATGRQCAVDAEVLDGETRAWRLRTTCFPAADVPMIVAGDPADMPGVVLDMTKLGSPELGPDELVSALSPLVTGYRAWLANQRERITADSEIARWTDVATGAANRADQVADRLERAVELLHTDAKAREAFRFANQAMASQRIRSELVRRRAARPDLKVTRLLTELDQPRYRSWRPFQLAFVLLCLPGLTDPAHRDAHRGPLMQGECQLLFFPTGGGKTEAYLGLTAYTIAVRRLQGTVGDGVDARIGTRGVAVLMRYTLRLLTAQQFQRATALIAACELLRRERVEAGDLRWGDTPIRIGLWVGSKVAPNNFDEAVYQLLDATSQSGEGRVGGLLQFAACPWCGTPLDLGRDGHSDKARRRTLVFCGDPDGRCQFSRAKSTEGLPALVVDEEIYRLVPDLVIGTVDKFAALPWRSATTALFGHVSSECDRHGFRNPDTDEWCKDGGHPKAGGLSATRPQPAQRLRPPDLIIQDELHLISDALGSMVGLYETLVDRLSTRRQDGLDVRPVLVASTATVRRARQQVAQVFARGLTVFPPPVLDAGATFFSQRTAPSAKTPARRYRGIMASGERLTAIEIRVMTALLEFGQHLLDRHGDTAMAAVDPYLTVVDYFSSTRELAGMNRLVQDDVAERLQRQGALVKRRRPVVQELTSRMDSTKITQSLAQLERTFDPEYDSTAGIVALRALRREDKAAYDTAMRDRVRQQPIDVLLATSMLQVGVDVQRLGLMVVTGQPKNMAEYIQASSRVGRSVAGPGLVLTIYNWNRPRDLAHYETFAYEHVTFGRRVEGLTTTPFSKRALDRGLTAVVVGAIRHRTDVALPNDGAHRVPLDHPAVADLLAAIRERAAGVVDDVPSGQDVADQAQGRIDRWSLRRSKLQADRLGYQGDATHSGLLRKPDQAPWDDWSAPMSLRDVEPEVLLQLRRDDPSWDGAPPWDFTPRPPAGAAS